MNEQEQYVRENIVSIAESAFPDNTGNDWLIHDLIVHPGKIEVEVESIPDNVGYPRIRFFIGFEDPDKPNITECYCLAESGEWDLLFTG